MPDFSDLPLDWALGLAGLAVLLIYALSTLPRRATGRRGAPPIDRQAVGREALYSVGAGQIRPANAAAGDPATELSFDVFLAELGLSEDAALRRDVEALGRDGTAFDRMSPTPDGRHIAVGGWTRGARAWLSVLDATDQFREATEMSRAAEQEIARSSDQARLLENAPLLQWRIGAEGDVIWSNAEARRAAGLHETALDLVLARLAELRPEGQPPMVPARHRIGIQPRDGSVGTWFDVTELALPGGGHIGYAIGAEQVMRAEAALARFVETLTETFAHLPIGLAIFDRNRELGLFNPALADLLKLDPAWLAGRPTLTAFLNQLRERRAIPDQRDYRTWRSELLELGQPGGSQHYAEVWVQPSGRTLRVNARPHPQGAIALLLEDITPAISLEQHFREGMEMREAALSRQPGAHAILDVSGAIQFMDAEMPALLGPAINDIEIGAPGGVHRFLDRCGDLFGGSVPGDELLSFVVGGQSERMPIACDLTRPDGSVVVLTASMLPGGGSLISLTERMMVAPAAPGTLAAALDAALSHAAGLSEPMEREVTLDDDGPGELPCSRPDLVRRVGVNLLLAAVDLSGESEPIRIDLRSPAPDLVELSCACRAAMPRATTGEPSLPLTLLRRFLAEEGGEAVAETSADEMSTVLRVTLPISALMRTVRAPMLAAPRQEAQGG
ncbi:PAS-domain containing protein [Pontivivens ytuae]|uniref:PAS-domain containing protein n=1 Tax=Pontivivens ytuae TaxID=2789856 RepID=A0A7S9LPC0_9RHOB|nr:PAS-domain containing protein [Pontivivens ytuae]QPH52753.1 PAS-domain containing protein [Pontivivens ytuae]